MFYDKQLLPLTQAEREALFADLAYRFVATDELPGDCRVLTIWEGVAKPAQTLLVFESMVFGGPLNGASQRYASLTEARSGHRLMVLRAIAAQLQEIGD